MTGCENCMVVERRESRFTFVCCVKFDNQGIGGWRICTVKYVS